MCTHTHAHTHTHTRTLDFQKMAPQDFLSSLESQLGIWFATKLVGGTCSVTEHVHQSSARLPLMTPPPPARSQGVPVVPRGDRVGEGSSPTGLGGRPRLGRSQKAIRHRFARSTILNVGPRKKGKSRGDHVSRKSKHTHTRTQTHTHTNTNTHTRDMLSLGALRMRLGCSGKNFPPPSPSPKGYSSLVPT
jgi:hypothetical protein